MIKALSWRFCNCLGRFHVLTSQTCSETALFRECYMQFFSVCYFGNTLAILAMTIIFFFKIFKIWCTFQKWNKKLRKKFYFSDSCIWIVCCKFSQSWTKYLPSAVNVLTLTNQISPKSGGDIFQINSKEKDQKTM